MTKAEYKPELDFTKDTPYLALTGELWDVFCDDFRENWPLYHGTARVKMAPYCIECHARIHIA